MTSLHAYFHNRDQAAFQRQLAAAPLQIDVNARDWLGRTVLHLACATSARAATEYVRMLLAHPGIDVNLQDTESHWAALHRALYNGNIGTAILLLQRSDINTDLKDFEGYRAFDVYNTTVEDTMPNKLGVPSSLELYTWGANRNTSLGHGDTDDRTHPEQVVLGRQDEHPEIHGKTSFKLQPALVRDVQMSKLHTVVLTDEPRANIRACGFASGGRLGPGGGQHTQPSLLPSIKPDSEGMFTAISLGQDHTLALTADGTVFSWGLGRFSQLGYELASPYIQSTPRVVAGPLRRERVRGIAACKSASACWTDTLLYTWGKNNGQLGYDRNTSPAQPIPRIVTKITKPVISIALNDTAMLCLLATQDVILLFNDTHSRIVFPSPTRLPSDFLAYRPPQAARTITTARILCNENTFAAVSSAGEIFTFNAPTPPLPGERPLPVQPQRVWALRKQWSAVHDAALGGEGSLIICTQSGHVFLRSRSGGAKAPRFMRVARLQRTVAVRASDTGALAALRDPYRPSDILPVGYSLAEDLGRMRPYFSFTRPEHEGMRIEPKVERPVNPVTDSNIQPSVPAGDEEDERDGSFEAEALARDAQEVLRLWDVLAQDRIARRRSDDDTLGQGLFANDRLVHGADLMVRIQGSTELPVHRVMLSARCAVLARVLDGFGGLHDRESGISVKLLPAPSSASALARQGSGGHDGARRTGPPPRTPAEAPRLAIAGVHAFSVLLLLHYLYTDALLAIGDPRLAHLTADAFSHGRLRPAQAVHELQTLSRVLHLDTLENFLRGAAVVAATMRAPSPSLDTHFRAIFDAPMSVSVPDVVLRLADREVWTHSFVLRARSPFFETFFSDEDWTRERFDGDGRLCVDLSHLEWRFMQYVLRFMCCGEEAEMFERLHFVDTADQLLSLLFEVMFAANELLLDRLLLICSSIVIKYVSINNISAIYVEAASLHCPQLMDSLHQYMAVNMETLLEARLLDDLSPQLLRQLAGAVQDRQAAKSPFSRVHLPVYRAASVEQHREWIATQDIPCPVVPSQQKLQQPKPSSKPKTTKPSPKMQASRKTVPSLPASPARGVELNTMSRSTGPLLPNAGEDLFCMDEALVPPLNLDAGHSSEELASVPKSGPWKAKSMPKVDMKAILAEAEEIQASERTQYLSTSPLTPVHRQNSRSGDGDGLRVAFLLPKKTQGVSLLSSPGTSRAATGSSPGRPPTGQMSLRTPSGSTQGSADGIRVASSPPKTSAGGFPRHPGSTGSSRAVSASTPAWRVPSLSVEPSGSPPGRQVTAQAPPRTPPSPASMQVPEKASPAAQQRISAHAPVLQKSWSAQSVPGPSMSTHTTTRPGLGPVISPPPKAKAGLTATRPASANAWSLPPAEPVSQPSPNAPISFAEIQQLQSRPHIAAKEERRSLRDIQAEETELQAEAEFMKWWTAEEERIRLENEAIAASLLQEPQESRQRQQQHRHGRKGKKSAPAAEGESASGLRAPRGGGRKRQVVEERVPSEGKDSHRV